MPCGKNAANDYNSLLMFGRDLLTAWYTKLPDDDFTILAIEEAFSFNLPGIDIPFIGALDLVEQDNSGTIIITDFKTSGQANFSILIEFLLLRLTLILSRAIIVSRETY